MSSPPGPAASTMPSDTPKRILRGARFATTTREPADQLLRCVGGADAREHRALLAAEVDVEPQQLVGAVDQFGRVDARDAQVDPRELVDRRCGSAVGRAQARGVAGCVASVRRLAVAGMSAGLSLRSRLDRAAL